MSDCQICGSNNKSILIQLCSNMDIMGPCFEGAKSNIVVCKKCGNVYVDIDVDQSVFTKYYSSNYSKSLSYSEVFGQESSSVYYENICERIGKYIEKNAKLLEIGGGIGELSEFIRNKGYDDITVMEPSNRCIELCKKNKLKTICSDAMEVTESELDKYDFVIVNHTLEHVLRFDVMMKSIRRMLKHDGFVYIEVPDASRYTDVDFVPYWFFTYEHIAHFTLNSFDNIAAAFGYKVCEKKRYKKCDSYNVMYAVFQKSECFDEIHYIADVEQSIKQYIGYCKKKLLPVIRELEKQKEPLVLWGVGTSTAQLLSGNFDNCNIVKLIDSNPYRQNVNYWVGGKEYKIEAPESVANDDGTILILPLMYDKSIRLQIKEMGLKNEVKSLIKKYKG